MSDYMYDSGFIKSSDGLKLFLQAWKKAQPWGIIVICHGVGEHSGRYGNLLNIVKDHELSVYALDHRGHGKSEGKRGHIMSFDEYVDDFDLLVKKAAEENPGLPLIILGHSMGGTIVIKYVLKYGQGFAGLVLSSAGLIAKVEVPPVKVAAAKLLSRIMPSLTMSSGLDSKLLSHDSKVVEAYVNDPLVHDQVSSRWYTEFIAAGQECLQRAAEITLPVLIIHGQADGIVDFKGSEEVMQKASSQDKELHIFENLYHETMNESAPDSEKVLEIIKAWIIQQVSRY